MPQYSFYCSSCNLQFKRRMAVSADPAHKCPSCAKQATHQLEGFGFGFSASPGTAKANSGVSKDDYPTADNIVGRSAEARWNILHERNRAKGQIRDQGLALSRRDFVDNGQAVSEYHVLGKSQFAARKALEGTFKDKAQKDGIVTSILPEKKV